MSSPLEGFCGPSYQLTNKYAAIERTVNFLLEANQSEEEKKFKYDLVPCPGNMQFGTLPVPAPFNQPNRGLIEYRGAVYGVNGSVAFSMSLAGQYTLLGNVSNDGHPVSMAGNGNNQLGIASAQSLYVVNTVTGIMTQVPEVDSGFLGAAFIAFQDGYLIALTPASNQFQISGTDAVPVGDMTQWDSANVSIQAGQADLLASLISAREYLRLLGNRRSQVYYNAGANGLGGFPFVSYNSTFIETGIIAPFSLADMGDSLIWIGQDVRGFHTCFRDSAFQPRTISTFAVSQFWAQYPRIDDAIAFAYIWRGHTIYRVTFPAADKTWEYDLTVSDLIGRPVWTERNYTASNGAQGARPEQFHCFCYALHLVGSTGADGNPGAVYQYSDTQFSDCGVDYNGNQIQVQIVRDRICPHLWAGNKRVIYNRIEFELSRGIGLDGSPPVGVDPMLNLKWSDDAGNTWGPWYQIPAGKIGQYGLRVYQNRTGYARDRVFWVRCSDPVYWGLVAAEIDTQVCSS